MLHFLLDHRVPQKAEKVFLCVLQKTICEKVHNIMKSKIIIILMILTQTILFTSLLMPMSMPKRIGVGVAFDSEKFVIPIWISEKFVVEPEFRFWKQKSLQSNSFELVEYRRIIKFGIGFFRRFSREELSFCAGIRTDVSQDLTIEDYFGHFYD